MKRLIFIGIAAVSMSACAGDEGGYGAKLKKETNRLIAEIKSVGKELSNLVLQKKDVEKNEKKESALAYVSCKQAEPVIIESCDHCKDLCTKDQSAEHFA